MMTIFILNKYKSLSNYIIGISSYKYLRRLLSNKYSALAGIPLSSHKIIVKETHDKNSYYCV